MNDWAQDDPREIAEVPVVTQEQAERMLPPGYVDPAADLEAFQLQEFARRGMAAQQAADVLVGGGEEVNGHLYELNGIHCIHCGTHLTEATNRMCGAPAPRESYRGLDVRSLDSP